MPSNENFAGLYSLALTADGKFFEATRMAEMDDNHLVKEWEGFAKKCVDRITVLNGELEEVKRRLEIATAAARRRECGCGADDDSYQSGESVEVGASRVAGKRPAGDPSDPPGREKQARKDTTSSTTNKPAQ